MPPRPFCILYRRPGMLDNIRFVSIVNIKPAQYGPPSSGARARIRGSARLRGTRAGTYATCGMHSAIIASRVPTGMIIKRSQIVRMI